MDSDDSVILSREIQGYNNIIVNIKDVLQNRILMYLSKEESKMAKADYT